MTREEVIELGTLLRNALMREGSINAFEKERMYSLMERFKGDEIMQARVLMEFANKAELAPVVKTS